MTGPRDPDPAQSGNRLRTTGLPLTETLLFRFGLLFVVLLAVLGAGAFAVCELIVQAPLHEDIVEHEQGLAERMAAETSLVTDSATQAAVTLSSLAASEHFAPAALRAAVLPLIQNLPSASRYAAVGLWPEPGVTGNNVARASLYWVRDADGKWQARDDYNDPKTAPYYQTLWYASARFTPDNHCYWSPVLEEPISKRSIVTCSTAVRVNGAFLGAATVSIDLQQLADALNRAASSSRSYVLLLDRDDHLLAAGGSASGMLSAALSPGRDIAELAQKLTAYNPLALMLHKRSDALAESVLHSKQFQPTVISKLQDASNGTPRAEAEAAMYSLWQRSLPARPAVAVELEHDPALDGGSLMTILSLPETGWQLVRGTSAEQGLAGVRYLTQQTLLICIGLLAAGLLFAFGALRATVVRPLQRIAARLIAGDSQDNALGVTLDHKARNEIGFIAQWQNERIRQLRDLTDRAAAANRQLLVESGERARVQKQLAQAQEQRRALVESIDEAVLVCDEHGVVQEINPMAERLLGMRQDAVREQPLGEVFIAQIDGDSDAPVAEAILDTLQRGTPLEFRDNVLLRSLGGLTEISLSVTPLHSGGARADGCLVVFREAASTRSPSDEQSHDSEVDAQTGLGRRGACERRVRKLGEGLRGTDGNASLLVVDIDGVQQIVDRGGVADGTDALSALVALLSTQAGVDAELFRLPQNQFAIVLNNADVAETAARAEALRAAVAGFELDHDDEHTQMHASIGYTPIDTSAGTAADVVRHAIKAAAAAKSDGGDCVRAFEPTMDREAVQLDELWVRRIRRGLDENLFHLSTQWIAPSDSLSGEGAAYELLLALEDEEGFWSPPAAFLPVVERHGLSSEVDQWVVGRVLDLLSADPGLSARLAFANINVSAGTICDSGFLDFLSDALAAHPDVPPSKLCFDLPLGAASDPAIDTPAFCKTVGLMGARTCLSPGPLRRASELDMLRRLPVDILAFDAPLFPRLHEDPAEQLLAEALVKVGRLLKRRVLITRIETAYQTEAWRRLGADYFQGYAIAKPTPVMFQAPAKA